MLSLVGLGSITRVGAGITQSVYTVGSAKTAYINHIFERSYFPCHSAWEFQWVQVYMVLTIYRLMNIDLLMNETFFFEMNYPLVLTDQERSVDVRQNVQVITGTAGTFKSLVIQTSKRIKKMGVKSTSGNHDNVLKADGHLLEFLRSSFGFGGGGTNFVVTNPGIVASGGVISDYTSGDDVYRVHVFTSSGTFAVRDLVFLGTG